jgi:hypothetical protein
MSMGRPVHCLFLGLLFFGSALPASAGERDPGAARRARDPAVAREFQRLNPCPSTGQTSGACPGYVRDHVIPLHCGGSDTPSNMEWQTILEARAKDRDERTCRPIETTAADTGSRVTVLRGRRR